MSLFVTFEGPDGSGKTTQAHLLADVLRQQGYAVVSTREPGGSPIGDQIRAVLHDCANTDMTPRAEFLLYSASRAQLVDQVIRPALAEGKVVLCDRFYDSSLAYQGYGRQLDLPALREITRFATGGLVPDLTLYLDLPPDQGLERRLLGSGEWNRLDQEALAFHQRVRAGYLALSEMEPTRWCIIDGNRAVETVQAEVQAVVLAHLGACPPTCG
ncbi:MAG: dTMP kinase [Anaerolineae bacterium]|nr:dTMP kinase [Anaerolineae bacterium]